MLALSLSTVTAAAVAAPLALNAVRAESDNSVRIGPAVSAEEDQAPNSPTIDETNIDFDGSRDRRGNIGIAPQTNEVPRDSRSSAVESEPATTETSELETTETEQSTTTTTAAPESTETTVGSIGPSTTEGTGETTVTTEATTTTTEAGASTTLEGDSSTTVDQSTTSEPDGAETSASLGDEPATTG